MSAAYSCPLFDSDKHIENGFINIYRSGEFLEPGYCRQHRESVYHEGAPTYRFRIKVKEAQKS